MINIPFNKPYLTGKEQSYIQTVIQTGKIGSGGAFTQQCEALIRYYTGAESVLLTNSCTAALEMAAILLQIKPSDEIIIPSFTFPSTANAFILRGAKPVFVDIRQDTLNIDETKIEAAITSKTKAIIAVHYAGSSCEMNTIMKIANKHGLFVIEDAAQAFLSEYHGKQVGTTGHLATFSFHATKNISCGEGGALIINDQSFQKKAEILRNKGTNRKDFLLGEVKKYTWMGLGSSCSMGELTAAYLYAQLEEANIITKKRQSCWQTYNDTLKTIKSPEVVLPSIEAGVKHNGHIYYILLPNQTKRDALCRKLAQAGIQATSHYEPLHLAPAGLKHCKTPIPLPVSNDIPTRILRLPLWPDLPSSAIDNARECITEVLAHT